MFKTATLLAAAASTLLLSACSDPAAQDGAGRSSNDLTKVQAEFGVGGSRLFTLRDGTQFRLDLDSQSTIYGAECPGVAYSGPLDARYVVLEGRVQTFDPAPEPYESVLAVGNWKSRSGERVLSQAGLELDAMLCRDDADPLMELEPNAVYPYAVVLPVPDGSGTLIYADNLNDIRFELEY